MPEVLPSGLPVIVADEEPLSRFLFQSSLFSSNGVKPAAWLPNPAHRNTSVFRLGEDPQKMKEVSAQTASPDRQLKAVAVAEACVVRQAGLEVLAEEPPPAHANIEAWPWPDDRELAKAQQKERAMQIAAASRLVFV